MRDYDEQLRDAARTAALSAGGVGLIGGGVMSMLGGKRRAAAIARDALMGAIGAGGLAGGGTYVGGRVLGPSSEEDPGQFTRRGGVGGALLGATAGGGLGATLAAGGLARHIPDNLVGDYLRRLAARRSLSGVLKGAGAGAAALGLLGGYFGSSEGMGVDYINNEARRQEGLDAAQRGT